jgi:16S rRNA G966 N2-methylase RsmD
MDINRIREKFGDDYHADDRTYKMGIDQRFTNHFAERFKNCIVLETCTGSGFTTISLAKIAKHVFTIEINQSHQEQAIYNVKKAGLSAKVSFISGDILDPEILEKLPVIDAAFIDPDWADEAPDHIYRFIHSSTKPPADQLLNKIFKRTKNIALILPPFIDVHEFNELPDHELERLYLGDNPELLCLYFGNLILIHGKTKYQILL